CLRDYSLFLSLMCLIRSLLFSFFFDSSPLPRYLHSFPTRRSSDLSDALILLAMAFCNVSTCKKLIKSLPIVIIKANSIKTNNIRSEEHTSELQSRFDLVCRLLLEKKKINTHPHRWINKAKMTSQTH